MCSQSVFNLIVFKLIFFLIKYDYFCAFYRTNIVPFVRPSTKSVKATVVEKIEDKKVILKLKLLENTYLPSGLRYYFVFKQKQKRLDLK